MTKTFTPRLFDQNDKASFARAVEVALDQSHVDLRTPGALADKDIFQAAVLAAVLSVMREYELEEAADEADRTLRQRVRRGATQALRLLGKNYPEAVDLMARLAA